jgi:uncharacterized membrane protein
MEYDWDNMLNEIGHIIIAINKHEYRNMESTKEARRGQL